MTITAFAGHADRIAGTTVRVTRSIAAQINWREVFTIVALGLVTLVLLTYDAGLQLGRLVHRLNDLLAREWVAACGVLERPAAATAPAKRPQPAPQPMPVHVPAPVVAKWPPIDRAVALVKVQRLSQRAAARRTGVSRTSLQRALAAA